MTYSDVTLDHFYNPRNARRLDGPDVSVGRAGKPDGSAFMVFFLRLDDEGVLVREATFQTYGCAAAIAAGSVLTDLVTGLSRDEAEMIDSKRLVDALGGLPESKQFCASLAVDALRSALVMQTRIDA